MKAVIFFVNERVIMTSRISHGPRSGELIKRKGIIIGTVTEKTDVLYKIHISGPMGPYHALAHSEQLELDNDAV